MIIRLIKPHARYKQSYLAALKEFHKEGLNLHLDIKALDENFSSYIKNLKLQERGIDLPPGIVPDTVLWLVDGRDFLGRLSIRHKLTKKLRQVGGHIGYEVRASKRKKGYGSQMLKQGLLWANRLGLKKVLLTCDEDNIASKKIIEKNGGIFQSQAFNKETEKIKLRYWIAIGKKKI